MTRTVLLSCALVLAPGLRAAHADDKPKGAPVTVDLSGDWVYNPGLSDDAREKMRESVERAGGSFGGRPGSGGVGGSGGRAGGPGGGGRVSPPPGGMGDDDDTRASMRAILEPAEEITIAQTATEVAVEEKFGQTRRLHPDGKRYKADNGTSEMKASWKEGQLVVETKRGQGDRVLETWERVPDGSQLVVSVKVEGGLGSSLVLKRVYDRARDESPK
jgi:hypothetical protein